MVANDVPHWFPDHREGERRLLPSRRSGLDRRYQSMPPTVERRGAGERRVRAVVHASFIGDQLMTGRDGDIDPDPVGISFLMSVVRLLNGDVATVDVVAEFFQARGFLEDDLVDGVGFIDAPVSDVDG